jgi:hypothetical protein
LRAANTPSLQRAAIGGLGQLGSRSAAWARNTPDELRAQLARDLAALLTQVDATVYPDLIDALGVVGHSAALPELDQIAASGQSAPAQAASLAARRLARIAARQ